MTDRNGAKSRSTSQGAVDAPRITLADAQANADAAARRFVDSSSLSPTDRQDLVDQLRRETETVQALTVHPDHDWTAHQAYRAFGEA